MVCQRVFLSINNKRIIIIIITKRIKLDVESGAESLAGIFQDSPGSITQDPSDDIDSIVRDVIDYIVHNNCNGTLNEPRNVCDKYHQQNALVKVQSGAPVISLS